MNDTTTGRIEYVNPADIELAPNVRQVLDVDPSFVDSVRELGILQPPMVTYNFGYKLVLGQRRRLAAIRAGLTSIPVYVVDEQAATTARVLEQLAENEQREQLTNSERAGGYKTLALEGVTVDVIAKRTGAKRTDVEAALKVVASEKAAAALQEHQLTFDQAAALVEFEDDKKAVQELTDTAVRDPKNFTYRLEQLRTKRNNDQRKKDLQESLRAEGTTIVKAGDYPSWLYSGSEFPGRRLTQLTTDTGRDLSADRHKKCPGHAAIVTASDYYGSVPEIVYVCTDWKANGHRTAGSVQPAETPEQRAEREQREREQAELDQARDISRTLRHTFVLELLGRPIAQLRHLHMDALHAAASPLGRAGEVASRGYSSVGPERYAASFLGLPADTNQDATKALAEATTSTHPTRLAIAYTLAIHEYSGLGAWNYPDIAPAYLTALAGFGHTLTEYEQQLAAEPEVEYGGPASDDDEATA